MTTTTEQPARKLTYAWYVTIILLLAYTLSFVDRQVLGLLVQPIERDLGLTDASFSIIAGFAFAMFYTIIGLFLGRVADHWNRRNLIMVGLVIWTLSSGASAYAVGFWSLFAARLLVGFGEAALSPSAYSMLSDYFPPDKRARAMSLYTAGVYIGSAVAFIAGGLVIEATSKMHEVLIPLLGKFTPWQSAFVYVSLPGIPVIALMLTVREPRRHEASADNASPRGKAELSYFLKHLRLYLPLLLATGITAMITYGIVVWLPAVFIRRWHWTPGQIGPAYGIIILICGITGMLVSGYLADRYTSRGRAHMAMTISLIATAVLVPGGLVFAYAPNPTIALGAVAVMTFFLGMPIALAPPMMQAVTPNRLRGQITSIYLLMVSLIGLGLGPFLVAALTDYVFKNPQMVGLSLGLMSAVAALLGALCLALARTPYRQMLVAQGEE